jgi:polyisoprenoid-binding protein YceI
MKSLITNIFELTIFELAKKRTLAVLVALLLPTVSPLGFAAGGTAFSLDATSSSAQLVQGSRANPDSANTGVARVTGDVMLDPNDLDSSVFDLSIYPANEHWGKILSKEGNLPSGFVPDASDHTLFTFKSTRIMQTASGRLEVTGDLTLTRVERSVMMDGNEAYAGPVYGKPVIHAETREITFLLNQAAQDLTGSARIVHEDFPEVVSAIQATNWPTVVKDEKCQAPSIIGDDYHGAVCTGTVIAAIHNHNCQEPNSPGGEGYTGPVCTPPAGDQTTILLDLKLLHTGSEQATAALSGSAGTR